MLDFGFYRNVSELPAAEVGGTYLVAVTEEFVPEIESIRTHFKGKIWNGMIVPYIILNDQLVESGIGLFTFRRESSSMQYFDLQADVTELREALEPRKNRSLFLFADGLSPYLDTFVSSLNKVIHKTTVFGSGLGYKKLLPGPVLFNDHQFCKDCALLISTELVLKVGVGHGWNSIYGPLVVTDCQDNVIKALNGEPAFEVYRKTLYELEQVELTRENFSEVVPAYPFGISSFISSEFIIRDPIAVSEEGYITTVSSVAMMDTLYIMRGNKEDLLGSSHALGSEVLSRTESNILLLFDCISRVFFLGDDFEKEIHAIYRASGKEDLVIIGLTSVGEICNSGYEEIKVFNKTTLLGAVEHG